MKYRERPFEYLRRKKAAADSEDSFDQATISNWYKARLFVLDKLSTLTLTPEEDAHLHVIVLDDDDLMLSVIRHVALYSHFANFNETFPDESRRNRTVITLVSENKGILAKLKKEEFLCNLPNCCKCSYLGEVYNKDSFLDVELEIIEQWADDEEIYKEIFTHGHIEKRLLFRKRDVDYYCSSKTDEELYSIDTRKAQYTNRIYSLGCEIDNLPYDDIHSVERYSMALNVFQYSKLREPIGKIVLEDKWKSADNQIAVLTAMSNIFCSDCYIIRFNSMRACLNGGKMTDSRVWERYYDLLSRSEHSRWVVEKLVLGYRPFNLQERLRDESLVVDKENRMKYRTELKNNWKSPAHIDICSFTELRRKDPGSLKFDSFLVLCIPAILKKTGEVK